MWTNAMTLRDIDFKFDMLLCHITMIYFWVLFGELTEFFVQFLVFFESKRFTLWKTLDMENI